MYAGYGTDVGMLSYEKTGEAQACMINPEDIFNCV